MTSYLKWVALLLCVCVCVLFGFYSSWLWPVDCVLFMWGMIMIPMYRLWLHSWYGPHCLRKAIKLRWYWIDSAKHAHPWSTTDEKLGGPVKNMGGPIKPFYVLMFEIVKSCQKCIFWPVKHEKFLQCLIEYFVIDLHLRACWWHQIVMAKHGGSCVHFSGISTCGRTSRETVSHSQRQPLPTPHKIALPVYVTVTNKRLQPLTTTLYNSLVLSFSMLTTKRRLINHRSFLRVLRSS